MSGEGEQFKCEACGGTFLKGWSDEESNAEAADLWGTIEDPVLICDPCFRRLPAITLSRIEVTP